MTNKRRTRIGIVTMIFLFGMISFVTNLAAPMGNIWKMQPGVNNSNVWGMMGNMMNFLAYLIMGIPAGKILSKKGYRKTALIAIVVGFWGIVVQFLSGKVFFDSDMTPLPSSFFIYLLGAFISGFCVCLLNTVVNPMLNILGGGGKHGNQLIQIGGTFNSLTGTITPMLVGVMIGELTKQTHISEVNPLLFIAMGVFVIAFIILSVVPFDEPTHERDNVEGGVSPWHFPHFVLGAVAIFIYVGVEVGIPGTLNFYLSDSTERGAGLGVDAVTFAGFAAGTYWFMMLIGRFLSTFIASKVSSRTMLAWVAIVGVALVVTAILVPSDSRISVPVFTGDSFENVMLPMSALFLVLCGLCTSVMWGAIFNLAIDGLGQYTEEASGIFMMLVVGGGILPLIQNAIADHVSYMISFIVSALGFIYILWYALRGCKLGKKAKETQAA